MDLIDYKLLDQLQRDVTTPITKLAEMVNLSATPCWRRIQRFDTEGIITGRVALLDAKQLGVAVTVFVSIKTRCHSQEWFERFKETIATIPEVMEFYRMSGNVDYLLRVVVKDIDAYDAVYKKLIANTDLSDVSSSFAMEQIKFTTALPLPVAPER
ncbi:Lrp/AsnC family transcriptional regulator [Chitinasiproducens palmae]|uniref:Transcriptional regulator, AsnC family n=1 Tax=Chitinasiproducens palmae TaxID=1770053 RepID=A0A1H2PN15_9BURK|nr:Lrp/AsnC family transcriptional regulator [Chitinasiproducens palmae]SDV48047.1 transcriptional regulator, AsnC family [Chitinasiproducens palmae]